jgi:hypothetical protein
MADTAFITQFRNEFIAGFEQRQSVLRGATTPEFMMKGNTATFLVADSNDATAVTRGVNGRIPSASDNLTQVSATLQEWHHKPIATSFNIFASQGDRNAIMQMNAMAVINRKIDADIIEQLDAATLQTNTTGVPASMRLVNTAVAGLGANGVPFDGNIWGAITPAFLAYLMELPEFSSADFVSRRPLDGAAPLYQDKQGFYEWMGIKWIVSVQLTGIGTATEKCYVFHKSAIGHAYNKDMAVTVGYNDEDDYSFVRATIFMGSKLLQNTGVARMNHDGSALVLA